MNGSILASPVVWAAIAVLVVVRQFAPQPVRPGMLVVLPLVLAFVGWQAVASHPPTTTPAVMVFALDAGMAVGFGLARAASLRLWRAAGGTWMQRGTWLTLGLWVAAIAARVGVQFFVAGLLPLSDVTFFLALTFGAQSLLTWLRTQPVAVTARAS